MTDTGPTLGRLLGTDDDTSAAWDALRTVMDPELGVNIVDLGLVYEVVNQDGFLTVTMTTTTPACPIGNFLEDQVRWALLRLPDALDVEVWVTHEPPWSTSMMSEAAKERLGWMA